MNSTQLYPILQKTLSQIPYLGAEYILTLGILLIFGFDIMTRKKNWQFFSATIILLATSYFLYTPENISLEAKSFFFGQFTVSYILTLVKYVLILATWGVFILLESKDYKGSLVEKSSEFYLLILTSLLASFVLVNADHFMLMFLSFEFFSIISYILVILSDEKKSREAALKYLVFGLVSAGVLLYGISLVYKETGILSITDFVLHLELGHATLVTKVGYMLILLGLFFKIALVPMHFWVPDVYQGVSWVMLAFLGIISKLAGFVVLIKFIIALDVDFMLAQFSLQKFLAIIAVVTLTAGNVAALWQKNLKRLMAYSSIAHSGFILVGLVAFTTEGVASSLFYFIQYIPAQLGLMYLFIYTSNVTNSEEVADLAGLGKKYPEIGIMAVILVFSLIGLPPTSGFTAKFLIFSSLAQVMNSSDTSVVYLFVIGLINVMIGLFYYVKIPFFMFFRNKSVDNEVAISNVGRFFIGFLCFLLIALFFAPQFIYSTLSSSTLIEAFYK